MELIFNGIDEQLTGENDLKTLYKHIYLSCWVTFIFVLSNPSFRDESPYRIIDATFIYHYEKINLNNKNWKKNWIDLSACMLQVLFSLENPIIWLE